MENLQFCGFSETAVQMALKLMGFPKILDLSDPKGQELLDKLGSTDEAELAQQVEQLDGGCDSSNELDSQSQEALKKVEALTVVSQVLRCMQRKKDLPVSFVAMCKADVITPAQVHSWDDRDNCAGMQVSQGCRRALLRASVPAGQWGAVTGNVPLAENHDFVAIRISRNAPWWQTSKPSSFSGVYLGIILVDGPISQSARSTITSQGYARGCVVLRSLSKCITVCEGDGRSRTIGSSARFTLGSTLGIFVNRTEKQVHFFIQQPGGTEMVPAGSAPLPLASLAAVPFFASKSPHLVATFVDAPRPAAAACVRQLRVVRRSVAGPLAAFPCRNSVSLQTADWSEALAPEWPREADALIVEMAVKVSV